MLKLALTTGDADDIGPEVTVKALAREARKDAAIPARRDFVPFVFRTHADEKLFKALEKKYRRHIVASLDEAVGALGFVVGKRGRAPEGSLVAFELTGPVKRTLYVEVAGRAKVVSKISRDPDVSLTLESSLFMRLAGGRVPFDDVSDRVGIDGDAELGRRIAASLAFTV